MDRHRINLYEIENPAGYKFRYQFVQVIGLDRASASNPDLIDRGLNTLAKKVAIGERCPVAVVRESSGARLVVPADVVLSETEYHLAPDVVRLKPENRVRECHLGSADAADQVPIDEAAGSGRTGVGREGEGHPGRTHYVRRASTPCRHRHGSAARPVERCGAQG